MQKRVVLRKGGAACCEHTAVSRLATTLALSRAAVTARMSTSRTESGSVRNRRAVARPILTGSSDDSSRYSRETYS